MKLTPDDLKRLAVLAKITVSDVDVSALQTQLNGIFDLIDELQAVDTTGIEPLAHPLDVMQHMAQRLREDRVTETDQEDGLFPDHAVDGDDDWWIIEANAPAMENGLFLVPKVLD